MHGRLSNVDQPAASSPCAPSTLVGVRLADWRDLQGVHADLGVVHFQLAVSRIDDVENAVDCERGLGNVRCHDDLASPVRRGLEDLRLEVGGHLRVDGEHREWGRIIQLR